MKIYLVCKYTYQTYESEVLTQAICAFSDGEKAQFCVEKLTREMFSDKRRHSEYYLDTAAHPDDIERLRKVVEIFDPFAFMKLENSDTDDIFNWEIFEPFILADKIPTEYGDRINNPVKWWRKLSQDERMLLLLHSDVKPYGIEVVNCDEDI